MEKNVSGHMGGISSTKSKWKKDVSMKKITYLLNLFMEEKMGPT